MAFTTPHTVAYCRTSESTNRPQDQADDREEQKELQDLCHPLPERERLLGWNLALDP
jgi:DNA-directed RNA polymerase specialized sigma subunit